MVTKIPPGQNALKFKRKIEAGPFLYTAIKNFLDKNGSASELRLAVKRADKGGFNLDREARENLPDFLQDDNDEEDETWKG